MGRACSSFYSYHNCLVFPGTEQQIYNDEFYQQLDIVINALDNIEARRYVDRWIYSNLLEYPTEYV